MSEKQTKALWASILVVLGLGLLWIEREQLADAKAAIDASPARWESGSAPMVGISSAQARASSWGQPEAINARTSAGGTREQWVYGAGRYLYVEDGRVVSISERR